MLSDDKPCCHSVLENNEQQKLERLREEVALAWQRVSRQALLNKIIQAMRDKLVLDEILQTTVNQLKVELNVSHCLIFRPDEQNQMAVRYASESTNNGNLIGDYCPFYRYYHKKLSIGESVVLSQIDKTLPPEILAAVEKDSIRAILIVPLVYQKSYIGAITLVQCDRIQSCEPEPSTIAQQQAAEISVASERLKAVSEEHFQEWTASDVEFAQLCADHCAIAISQTELYQQLQTELAERKQVEEALRQSEARYRAIVEDQTELICRFKPDDTLTFVNEAYCRYFNKQRSELVGQKFLPAMPSDDRELISKNFRSLSQEQPINTYEHRIILPNGEIRWQQWSDRALFDQQGNFIECQAVGRDITKLKQAEADIRAALEKEREVNKLRSNFLSLVSHEFRTPLTIIQTSAELLEHHNKKFSDQQKQKLFTRLQSGVNRMIRLLDDVLTIGKAEAGKLSFNPAAIDLVAFCRNLIETMQMSVSSHHKLNLVIDNNCTDVQMDESLLEHILTNLLSNAIKYSPVGGTVQFELVCTSESAVFRVQDSGIGIPPRDLEKLFESFNRATNVGSIPGTGLGLAIVKKCVNLHGGEIAVESQLGVGTTFTVTLPLHGCILKNQT